MRVIVCGGRDYNNVCHVGKVLSDLQVTELAQGGCSGADTSAIIAATQLGIPFETYSADWRQFGRAAGPKRNQQMIDGFSPDLVIAFPGGRGTADMISRAKKAGIPIFYAKANVYES